jgi:hypothetical protein
MKKNTPCSSFPYFNLVSWYGSQSYMESANTTFLKGTNSSFLIFMKREGKACHGSINRSAMDGMVWWFVQGVNEVVRSGTRVARIYPASDPATMAKPYILL